MKLKIVLKALIALSLLTIITSCASKKLVIGGAVSEKLSAKNIIKNHYQNTLQFKTLRGRVKVDYTTGASSQGFTLSLRMEKDKIG